MPPMKVNSIHLLCVTLLSFPVAAGCSEGPHIVPVTGRVLLDGKPLEFGSVTFQPLFGENARGRIQKDGSFILSTLREGDGATVGENRVRVTCFEAQRAGGSAARGNQEMSLGRSLIPLRYSKYGASGLKVVVKEAANEPVVIELTDD